MTFFFLSLSVQVEFQDDTQLMLKRSEIHSLDQDLSKRVLSRLVSNFFIQRIELNCVQI